MTNEGTVPAADLAAGFRAREIERKRTLVRQLEAEQVDQGRMVDLAEHRLAREQRIYNHLMEEIAAVRAEIRELEDAGRERVRGKIGQTITRPDFAIDPDDV